MTADEVFETEINLQNINHDTISITLKERKQYSKRQTSTEAKREKTEANGSEAKEAEKKKSEEKPLPLVKRRLVNKMTINIDGTNFGVGQVVLAKFSRWPPWPAIVKEIYGFECNIKILVEFLGYANRSEAHILPKNIMEYTPTNNAIRNSTDKQHFDRAVNEANFLITQLK